MLLSSKLFREAFILLLMITTLHLVAIIFSLYFFYWWLDIVLHLLGGFWVGLTILWFFYDSQYVKIPRREFFPMLTLVLIGFLCVGIGWELFEYSVGVYFSKANYFIDTLSDIIVGGIGSIVALMYVRKRRFLENTLPLSAQQ